MAVLRKVVVANPVEPVVRFAKTKHSANLVNIVTSYNPIKLARNVNLMNISTLMILDAIGVIRIVVCVINRSASLVILVSSCLMEYVSLIAVCLKTKT